MKNPLIAILATFALSVGLSGPAMAQQQGQQPSAPQAQPPQVEVSDAELKLFLEAQEKVSDVRQSYQQQMAAAETSEDAQQLQQQASSEMVAAVEAAGISVSQFNQIAYALQAQPKLKSRLDNLQ